MSSATDMTRWVMMLLNKGIAPDGKRLLSEEQVNVLRTPLVLVGGRSKQPGTTDLNSAITRWRTGRSAGAIYAVAYAILDHCLKAPAKGSVQAAAATRSKRVAQAKKTMS